MVAVTTSTRARELFDEIVVQHAPALTRLCAGYELVPAQREELLQEILLALWRALPSYRGDASLRTWMYRVAHNVAISHAHRAMREPRRGTVEEERSTESGPDTELDEAQSLDHLRAAIAALAPLDRQLILLYLEELPQAEIASITGLTIANVSTRVGRIKERLALAVRRTT